MIGLAHAAGTELKTRNCVDRVYNGVVHDVLVGEQMLCDGLNPPSSPKW